MYYYALQSISPKFIRFLDLNNEFNGLFALK
jgi:hypothetical protein